MYIKIVHPLTDDQVLLRSPFGSRIYGTHTNKSDYDEVIITKLFLGDAILQYKDDKKDLIYVSDHLFWREIKAGGNQNFFETIHTEGWTVDVLDYYTPTQAKGYLGLAKRDIRSLKECIHIEPNKKIWHINRCIYMASKILAKEKINLSDLKNIECVTDLDILLDKVNTMRNNINWNGENL